MAGFRLVQNSAEAAGVEQWKIASLALNAGDLIEMDAGATAATAGDSSTNQWQRKGVAQEGTSATDTVVNVIVVDSDQVWQADSTNNSNRGHNGDRMALSATATVNNSGSDAATGVCTQIGVVGVSTDKDILVKFVDSTGGSVVG